MGINTPGVNEFTELSDVPNTYAGSANKTVVVDGTATGLEFATGGSGSPAGSNTQIQYNDSGSFGASADLTYIVADDQLNAPYISMVGQYTEYIWNQPTEFLTIQTIDETTPRDIYITGGKSTSGNQGASVHIDGGEGTANSDGGTVITRGGSVPSGGESDGGDISFSGGVGRGVGYFGGDVLFICGNATDGATSGRIIFYHGGASVGGIMNMGSIASSNKTFTFPNATGTLGVLVSAPASASATGVAGTIAYDSTYFYVCIATDTWKRALIETW